ncbi:DODA-type extradiol aromatic ring-opening family dioxygenase [Peribacillus sp. B-H-3]|uniref:DODA-type extradiol aromatic ring-opening family dioxygenase n=1 Tax=Peribacillus sp. B-H-3 TaxID=3400420 RepID=UPI003B01A65D
MLNSLFLAHGSPMLALEDNEYTKTLNAIGKRLNPKAVVIFTAHWESEIPEITFTDGEYETIYDFYGFPEELYAVSYPAKGSKEIALKVRDSLSSNGIASKLDSTRGLDHGSWTLLSHLFPQADVPVVQISINPALDAKGQFKIGEALRMLGEEEILVIGSGVTVHNLRIVKWGQKHPEEWAVEFDNWLIEKIHDKDYSALFNWETQAPHARLAVPREEHFVPLFIAMGSGSEKKTGKVVYRDYEFGNLSYLCLEF